MLNELYGMRSAALALALGAAVAACGCEAAESASDG